MLDAFAAAHDLNRSEATRLAVWRMLNAPEAYVAPTLPNWQTESWTLLLRGLFGKENLILTADVRPLLKEAVAALDARSAKVLNLRFGLNGPRHTLAEVAIVLGVNRQRIHQVERTALGQVRRWCRVRGIWELVGPQLNEESNE
jgi:hypothetical protein